MRVIEFQSGDGYTIYRRDVGEKKENQTLFAIGGEMLFV